MKKLKKLVFLLPLPLWERAGERGKLSTSTNIVHPRFSHSFLRLADSTPSPQPSPARGEGENPEPGQSSIRLKFNQPSLGRWVNNFQRSRHVCLRKRFIYQSSLLERRFIITPPSPFPSASLSQSLSISSPL